MDEEYVNDKYVRLWALEQSVASVRVNSKPSTIIKRAEKFYGFLSQRSAVVHSITSKSDKKKK